MLYPDQKQDVANACKGASMWGVIGVAQWSDVAAFFAAIYSLLLIVDFIWRKWLRDVFERRGWVSPRRRRRRSDFDDIPTTVRGDL